MREAITTEEAARRWAHEDGNRQLALTFPRTTARTRKRRNLDRMRLALDRKAGPELCFHTEPAAQRHQGAG